VLPEEGHSACDESARHHHVRREQVPVLEAPFAVSQVERADLVERQESSLAMFDDACLSQVKQSGKSEGFCKQAQILRRKISLDRHSFPKYS